MFTTLSWIERKLGLTMENEDFDILGDLIIYGHVPVDIKCIEDDWDCEYTDDLDKIYDYYLAP
jgi:hypothetical protein